MTRIVDKLKSLSRVQILAIVLIVAGLGAAIFFGRRMFTSYRELEYARKNNFEAGNLDPSLIRPWMNIRYIAGAYAVPQDFLLSQVELPIAPESSTTSIDKLGVQYGFAPRLENGSLENKLRSAIVEYRKNPVPTGLRKNGVRPWMNIQYIANSTGIPAGVIFEKIGVPAEGHAYLLMERLAETVKYPGGPGELMKAIQQVVDTTEQEKARP